MVDDTTLLSKHFANGIGQYSGAWDVIEAEWYMAGDKIEKGENESGFEIEKCINNGYLYFPNIRDLKKNTYINFKLKAKKGGKIEVRENSVTGKLLGELKVTNNSKNYRCRLKNNEGKKSLCLVFKGEEGENLFSIDSFSFQ
jgi:arabinoxylan arabinofuranohydrolase